MSYISNTPFDTVNKSYDGNGDTSYGSTSVSHNDGTYDVKFEGGGISGRNTGCIFRDVTEIHHNYTGHGPTNEYRDILYTYANGVNVVMYSYVEYANNKYWYRYKSCFEDEKGNEVDINALSGLNITWNYYQEKEIGADQVSNLGIYYSPSGYNYDDALAGTETTNAFSMNPMGQTWIDKPTASPYDRPALRGKLANDYYQTYYYVGVLGSDLRSDEDIGAFYDALDEAGDGSQIRPSDDDDDDQSGPGGGGGDKNPYSDPIEFPGLPTGGDSLSTGFITIYHPNSAQLRMLSNKLWSDDFIENILRIQNDPMEAIISLHSVPYNISGTLANCVVGNYDTQIQMEALNTQFYTLNLGSIYIPEHWGSALDYSPYTTIDIFLPYVGIVSVQVDDIMGKQLTVQYNTDVLSGATVAMIKSGDSVLYTYNTNLLYRHPFSANSYAPLYQALLGATGSTIGGGAMGGPGGAIGGAVGGALNVALSKHSALSRGGSIGSSSGCLGGFVPYIIIHRPIQSLASGFKHFKGYPSNITATIGSVSGYSEVESVHLTGIPCTDIERDEINALLYNGVIV